MLAACQPQADTDPVRVAAIGPVPAQDGRGTPSRLLTDATAQGLVRFDATGQIEPGLAERWIVADEGLSYIFRLREAQWADGSTVTSDQVAARLSRILTRTSLRPFLTAIDEVVTMTPQVVEVRLKRPRPDLLKLFAQPELALLRPGRAAGTGPLRAERVGPVAVLRPIAAPDAEDAKPDPRDELRLTGGRAALAVARFIARDVDLVAGGTFADWPLLAVARPLPATVRIDPAAGLFGLQVLHREGFLATPEHRAAIAQAFDRAAIVAGAPGWSAGETLLPEQLDSIQPPTRPAWAARPLDQRQADARAIVIGWGEPVTLRIALPSGPGATELWGHLAASLLRIGVTPQRVTMTSTADLRLIDAVAPYDSGRWYLATACQPCGGEALAKVLAARDAPTMAERAQRIAEADAALAADIAFIPLARPLRWSLVALRLRAWQLNARAWHPLNRLRNDPK